MSIPVISRYRWVICTLLFFAAAINYIDRQVIGILKPTLQVEFQFDERSYAAIVFSFQAAYAIGLLVAGRVMDGIGVRLGFALAVVVWSLGAMAHALADWFPWLQLPTVSIDPLAVTLLSGATAGFALSRVILGLGEAGNFPASIKTVAEWFPRRERALATGIFNSGTNISALLTPLLVPWITLRWGWQWAFITTGMLGFVWGIGGMAGSFGGMLIALVVGEILQRTGSYASIFMIAGSAYLVALLVIHLLAPRLELAKL